VPEYEARFMELLRYAPHLNTEKLRVNLYITTLGSFDVVIGMDWLESHEAILSCKTKWLSLVDDEGQRRVIVGQN
jgi:hypothetical protein